MSIGLAAPRRGLRVRQISAPKISRRYRDIVRYLEMNQARYVKCKEYEQDNIKREVLAILQKYTKEYLY